MTVDFTGSGANGMQTVLRVIPMPADLGVGQRIATGWLLAKLDQAGSVLPSGHFGHPAVLVECGPLAMKLPVHLGDCVIFRAATVRADALRAEADLHIVAERRGELVQREIMSARLSYMAVGEGEEDSLFPALLASRPET